MQFGVQDPVQVDVAIVGAGTAGAAAAALCAQRGLSVVCLDSKPLDGAGARWLNGVPLSAFDSTFPNKMAVRNSSSMLWGNTSVPMPTFIPSCK